MSHYLVISAIEGDLVAFKPAKLSKICESAKRGVDFWGDFR